MCHSISLHFSPHCIIYNIVVPLLSTGRTGLDPVGHILTEADPGYEIQVETLHYNQYTPTLSSGQVCRVAPIVQRLTGQPGTEGVPFSLALGCRRKVTTQHHGTDVLSTSVEKFRTAVPCCDALDSYYITHVKVVSQGMLRAGNCCYHCGPLHSMGKSVCAIEVLLAQHGTGIWTNFCPNFADRSLVTGGVTENAEG